MIASAGFAWLCSSSWVQSVSHVMELLLTFEPMTANVRDPTLNSAPSVAVSVPAGAIEPVFVAMFAVLTGVVRWTPTPYWISDASMPVCVTPPKSTTVVDVPDPTPSSSAADMRLAAAVLYCRTDPIRPR